MGRYWQMNVGLPGFYPFDLVAAGYVLAPTLFDCAPAAARVDADEDLWRLFDGPDALLVDPSQAQEQATTSAHPARSAQPSQPAQQGQPRQPTQPERPERPEQPEQPEQPDETTASPRAQAAVIYCPRLDPALKAWLMARLTTDGAPPPTRASGRTRD